MDTILKKVIRRITPNEKERRELSCVLKRVLDAVDAVIKPLGLEKTLAGSLIRDTWLTDKKEIDIFIMFPVSYPREKLEKTGLDIGRKIVKKLGGRYEISYAEHPYVKGKVNGFSLDIVPCYRVKSASKIKSAVDRTPFHNNYVLKHLRPEMSKEVRLLKQFCKAMDVYGSDIRTQGFSGYLCELLIIKYRTFKNLVKSARNWKFGEFIDLEGHSAIERPEDYFRGQPLIVIDPTDPKRNVAAALSEGNFAKFVETCRKFVEKPSERFFEIEKIPMKRNELRKVLKERGTELFVVKFKRPPVVDDILWAQMRKTMNRIVNLAHDNEFEVFMTEVWSDEKSSYMLLEMKTWKLPEIRKVNGPPVRSAKHVKEFREKYGNKAHIEGSRWVAEVKRKYREFGKLLESFLSRSRKKLLEDGVRSHIAEGISKGFRILKTGDVEKLIARDREFSVFLGKYFRRRT